jgi:hypothetical protein
MSVVSPVLGSGRIAFGVWQLDRHVLELEESLDLGLSLSPGGPPLSGQYESGSVIMRYDEGLNAVGAVWIQQATGGNNQFAVGVAYLNMTARGTAGARAVLSYDGSLTPLSNVALRRDMSGPALVAGFFYRPVTEGSLGVSLLYAGEMRGDVWEQSEGGPSYRDSVTRPAQLRLGLGGSFTVVPRLTAAVDLKYASESRPGGAVLFAGTRVARSSSEFADAVFCIHAGVEWRLRLRTLELPVRFGFFSRPDSLPVQSAGLDVGAVSQIRPASFRQDVTGVTAGSGWERFGLRADLALVWMMINTRVKLSGPTGPVDSGDVRSSVGAVGSLAFRFGPGMIR